MSMHEVALWFMARLQRHGGRQSTVNAGCQQQDSVMHEHMQQRLFSHFFHKRVILELQCGVVNITSHLANILVVLLGYVLHNRIIHDQVGLVILEHG